VPEYVINTAREGCCASSPISWCAFAKRTYCFNYDFNVLQILNKIRHALQKRARVRELYVARGVIKVRTNRLN